MLILGRDDGISFNMDVRDIKRQFPIWRGWYGRFLPKDKSAKILDVGCGRGGMVYWLTEAGYANVEGIDINRDKIDEGLSLGIKNINHGDAVSFLKGKQDRYDGVFMIDVLDSLTKEEVTNLLEEVLKSLKKGGKVVVRDSNFESPAGRLRQSDFGGKIEITEQALKNVLEKLGFKEVGAYPVRPVVHGIKSLVRYCLWRIIEAILKVYRLIEVGSPAGIFTQNIIAVGKKD
jgi:2-polyprenyl-3-methyl-5-hydroxy-6-metoxy-1,4-benzoquinol methylase